MVEEKQSAANGDLIAGTFEIAGGVSLGVLSAINSYRLRRLLRIPLPKV